MNELKEDIQTLRAALENHLEAWGNAEYALYLRALDRIESNVHILADNVTAWQMKMFEHTCPTQEGRPQCARCGKPATYWMRDEVEPQLFVAVCDDHPKGPKK